MTEFKRGIVPLSEFRPENDWDLLALAQHHGLPTRLLDWSSNALIGLWFTICHPPSIAEDDKLKDGVIWVFAPQKDDYRTDTTTDQPLNNGVTKVFKSSVVTRRISAQSGVFTLHKILSGDKFVKFENNGAFKDKLFPIYVKGKDFAGLRKELTMLGINHSSVFPDIDGYSKHIGWKYFKMEDEKF